MDENNKRWGIPAVLLALVFAGLYLVIHFGLATDDVCTAVGPIAGSAGGEAGSVTGPSAQVICQDAHDQDVEDHLPKLTLPSYEP